MIYYGMPYKGSKSRIADFVVKHIPNAENFYDIFGGGGSITHFAISSGKFKNIYYNELNEDISNLFKAAMLGEITPKLEWVSSQNYKLPNCNPLWKLVYSFGSNNNNYIYNKLVEPYKRALHYAIVHKDYTELKQMNINLHPYRYSTFKKNNEELKRLYVEWFTQKYFNTKLNLNDVISKENELIKNNKEQIRSYLCNALKQSGFTQSEVGKRLGNFMHRHYFSENQFEIPTESNYKKLQEFLPLNIPYSKLIGFKDYNGNIPVKYIIALNKYNSFYSVEHITNFNRILYLRKFKNIAKQKLYFSTKSYEEVEIKPNSVVYCDIPYKGTSDYNNSFDYDRFYNWARNQRALTIISEYNMPEDFVCVAQCNLLSTYSSVTNSKKVEEKLFVPKHQMNLYKEKIFKHSLFC